MKKLAKKTPSPHYTTTYSSPLGNILLASTENDLVGLWFENQKYFARVLSSETEEKEVPVLKKTKEWLDIYFSGKEPNFALPMQFIGTEFQKKVWNILYSIPYGKTVTYGWIAKQLGLYKSNHYVCARAVGTAVGKNDISIIVPCHRVVGANGSLTGYAGGVDRKIALLKLENVSEDGGITTNYGTAL